MNEEALFQIIIALMHRLGVDRIEITQEDCQIQIDHPRSIGFDIGQKDRLILHLESEEETRRQIEMMQAVHQAASAGGAIGQA